LLALQEQTDHNAMAQNAHLGKIQNEQPEKVGYWVISEVKFTLFETAATNGDFKPKHPVE
jgi:hypothetical protein